MLQIEIPTLRCYRCGNSWTPRGPLVRMCPRCKSKLWDEPKIRVPAGGGGDGVRKILTPHRQEILRIARKYGAREIRVFGSVARSAAGPRSDVDLLVDFDDRQRVQSSLRSLDLAQELEAILGRRVDVATEQSLHWLVQPQVLAEAVPL